VDWSVSSAGDWTALPDSPLEARHEAVGAWVDGRFVVVGGSSGPPCPPNASCVEPEDPAHRDGASFNPSTATWKRIADAPIPVSGMNAAVVDKKLYLLTGMPWRDDSPIAVLRYDPSADAWTRLPAPTEQFPELVAGSGVLFAVSGSDELGAARDFVLDEATGTWTELPDDPLGPSFDRQATVIDDALILTAKDLAASPGSEEPALVRVARLSADRTEWTLLPDTESIGWNPTAASGLIVFPQTGGADGGDVNGWGREYFFGGIYDPADGSWHDLPAPPAGGGLTGVDLAVGDRVLVGGHLLEARTGEWTVLPAVPGVDRSSETAVGGDRAILVWGGATHTENLADGYFLRLPPGP
jgi:hypothetical protein